MATYRGKIDLIDMREVTQAGTLFTWIRYADDIEGNGISSSPEGKYYIGIAYNKTSPNPSNNPKDYTWTLFKGESGVSLLKSETFYAISDNGVIPPVDTTKFSISENGELTFTENGVVYLVINKDFLSAKDYNENIQKFNITNNYLSGIGEEWTKDIPEVPKGYYLWTKTVYYYSDGTSTVQFLNSYQGKDGEDFNQFKLQFNQTEILKFAKKDGQGLQSTTVSPENLICSIIKEDIYNPEKQEQVTNLNIEDFSLWIYSIKTGEWARVDNSMTTLGKPIITIDELFNFNINLEQMIVEGVSNTLTNSGGENENPTGNIFNLFLTEESILRISYVHHEIDGTGVMKVHTLNEFLNVRYGMNRDMASLSIEANGIVAAMQDSQLVFNGNGLTVKNGSFSIQNSEEDRKLYMDTDGNLAMAGNIYAENGYFRGELQGATGSFTGELKAATGSFAGKITAESGLIGGFNIEGTSLFSTSVDELGKSNIILDGGSGEVIANNITLGEGARIANFINIGETVKLKSVNSLAESFIEVKNKDGVEILSLTADGTINVGNGKDSIIINGAEGYIMSQNFYDGMGWKISNTDSIFNNVIVKGSIKASVLEYGEVQAIGGMLVVRPSSRILKSSPSDENTILTLEEIEGFHVEDYCRVDEQTENELDATYYKIISIDEQNKTIIIEGNLSGAQGKPIVNFGHGEDSVGICINGSTSRSFGTPQSISVFDFNSESKTLIPRVILGKLPDEQALYGYVAGTYGLYAENVLLKGSLVTQTNTEKSVAYSGISTLYEGVNSPTSQKYNDWFDGNSGEILLWAGAEGTKKEDIENSKFFVDRNGNLYAGSGYFKGTIITDATITASEIETARIKGSGDQPALTIEDAARGIVFNATENGVSFPVFEVAKDHITANVSSFNFNNNFSINDKGSLVVPNLYITGEGAATVAENQENEVVVFDKHKISYAVNFNQEELTSTSKRYIDFTDGLAFSTNGISNIFELTDSRIRAKAELYLDGSIQYGEKMKYEPVKDNKNVLIGYDLYVE